MLKKISFLAFVFFFYANAFAQITPIPINYIDDLAKIGNNANYPMNGYYILQRDLDFNDSNAYSSPTQIPNFNGNWTGIASTATVIGNPFSGTFDGNYHIIKNWRSITLDSYKGFFRYAIGATIKNLGLVNIKILNANSGGCGGLLSSGSDLNINNCFVTGTIDAYNSGSTDFGGLVGIATISRITNCFTNVDIKSWDRYAGLVGYLNASSTAPNIIKNCYTAGKLQLQNAKSYGFLIGLRNVNTASKDSIINNYSVGKFVGTIPSNTYGGLLIGATYNQIATIRDTLFVKGCYSIENSINPIKFNFLSGNINYNTTTLNVTYMYDTVFKASSTKTFTPITTAAYSSTYLYNAANQQYPVLYRSDSNILLGGQRAVYPAVVEKNTGTITGIADSVKPVDNFTKNGNTVYTINNVNRISSGGVFAYFSINRSNGTLSWGETIPTGEYLVEVRGVNGTENSQSWIRISITRSSNALVAVNSQSVQFTTKDSTRNGDYIVIDTLNLINRNFTIETWAKMDVRAAAWKRIFDFGTGANGNGVLLGFPTSTQFGFHCNGVDKVVAFPAGFNPLAWNHYAITQENDIVKLYINGDFVTSGPGAKPSVGFNKNYIGRSNYNNDSCTAGKFSDFRIWLNAHSAEQIAALYNKKIPTNADSLYVFLPLTSNYFRELPILSNPIGNSSSNIYGQVPNPYFNRVSNTSVKNIYDSNQQYVFGTLNTLLQDNETIEIAVKDSNTWNPVSNVSGYLFSYKLPTNFISGNIYVRSKIGAGATKTTRFGNYYASSTYYVDWIGTGVTFNPNIPIKIYPKYAYNGLRYIIQRNKNKLADTFFNPLIGTFTDANQKMILNINQGFVRNDYRGTININNTFFPNAIFYNSYNNTDTLLKSQNTDTPINYIKVAYNKGNSMYIFKNNTPTGIYYPNNGISITNSLGQKNVFYDGASSILDLKNMYVYYGDSLKAVKYNPVRYVLNAFKTSSSNIPTALGNDSMLNDLRFYMQVRRNGVDITNYYSINRNNMVVTGSNRPVGTDSIFLRFIGIFDEEVLDTLLFNYTLYKPSFKYTPNASSAFNLGNKTAIFYPQVLDSGGKTLTFRLINTNTNYTVEAQTGTLKLINWDNAGNDTLRIEASNGMY
ncbi:MAG: LamG domain-containing protein, partial [Sediminibacterium sp.]|nr:LamG domain-containing protein [Sediminibacterium sp.]